MGKLMRRLGLSRQKARPSHPKADAAAREAFACVSAWKKDPAGGVIGVQKGPL
jgi:transposase